MGVGLLRLDEEVEEDEQRSEEGENHAAAARVEGNAAKQVNEGGRHSFQTRFRARAVERADGGVAGKAATHGARLVLEPNGNLVAATPDQSGAKHEEQIADEGEKSETRTLTPIHSSSQR